MNSDVSSQHYLISSVEKHRLSDDVAGRLTRAIQEGRFLPGERLPAERVLSKELGVSRPVLREALRTLESRGLVTIRHGQGTTVTDHSQLLEAPPEDWLTTNEQFVSEFYEARLAIEPECAALASQRATAEQIDELAALLKRAEQMIQQDNAGAFVAADIDFHATIARLSGNSLLYRMLDSIINPYTDLRQVMHRLNGHLEVAHVRHLRIFDAIVAGDANQARQAMVQALQGPLKDIQKI
jgi:GntR family transcriptional repressor for pyruvate dehydrogenase complex